ncbi:MAG: type II toxin-antitoxin system RelE/ParE family toxin [Campylobacterota bacterium]|nr:type II toxin-antitoxin system RelE/ParE family toxin [Campylobacterota bacterium]
MKYSFHPEAEIEFNISIDYYEECQINLSLEFANEVYKTIQRILDFPNAWQPLDNDIRRCLTNRFPFGIIYYQKDDEIIILAVMQLNRKPNYWLSRSKK